MEAVNSKNIDLVVVGPEAPLGKGIVNTLTEKGVKVFGPTKEAARIETSKVFSKDLMFKYSIPCAKSESFDNYEEAKSYLKKQSLPIVIKADGLAAGKGVVIAQNMGDALDALENIMVKKAHGDAGSSVLIEEFLVGKEMSFFSFSDGKSVIPFTAACDYKRLNDNAQGPNTGGMGSYSPPVFYTDELGQEILETIVKPTVEAMEKEGCPYKGMLYAGLMITAQGPKVMEFNARFGDPETQVVMPRLNADLVDIFKRTIEGTLSSDSIKMHDKACVGVVMASGGYPAKYEKGLPINGIDNVEEGVTVFHAGTRLGENNTVLTSGGRVLAVTALADTLEDARDKVYKNLPSISFKDCHYRKDIGLV